MKLITLNVWGGRGGLPKLLEFFKQHHDVDVFCLQEVWNGGEEMVGKMAAGVPLDGISTNLLSDVAKVLPHHTSYFRPRFRGYYGLAMFVRSDISILEEGEIYVYKEAGFISEKDYGDHAANMQYVKFETEDGPLTILNVHGMWNAKGKGDTDDRLLQSDKILSFVQELQGEYVLCGDFNLLPETESLAKFEHAELRNLIKEYGITSTRTSFYTKPVKFADYVFTSKNIEVKDFNVLPDEVSDHAPLYVECH